MNGIYFIASGRKYLDEAILAIEQVRTVMPNVLIALCTDQVCFNNAIDYVISLENPLYNFADKVRYFKDTPFENTIFLDTDVFVTKDISGLFSLLERFDVAAPHAPIEEDELVDLPYAFAEPNSGVIVYKKTSDVLKMFSVYEEHYMYALEHYIKKENNIPPDQPSFRYALYKNNISFVFLPHEYNCMIDFPCFLSGEVYILHGHYGRATMQKMEKTINQYTGIRVYSPKNGILFD